MRSLPDDAACRPVPLPRRPGLVLSLSLLLAGCANPGPPRPPSLHIPRPVTSFTAERVAGTVHLHWSVPDRSTDDLPLTGRHAAGAMRVDICRSVGDGPCKPLQTLSAQSGTTAGTDDNLPPELLAAPPAALLYRATLHNAEGRSDPASPEAIAASGPAPPAIAALRAESRADGVHLLWQPPTPSNPEGPPGSPQTPPGSPPAGKAEPAPGGEDVVLDRTLASGNPGILSGPQPKEPAGKRRFNAEPPSSLHMRVRQDRGGALDPGASLGSVYAYKVQRARSVLLPDGRSATVYGTPASVTVDRHRDTFPPATPKGLVAIAVFARDGVAAAAVNLSWEPNTEPDLQGYFIYRNRPGSPDAPRRLNATPTALLSMDDPSASSEQFLYSISAVNTSGIESPRSPEISAH